MVVVPMGKNYTFPAAPLDSGQVLWVIRDEAAYLNYFGAEMVSYTVDEGGSISQNGDDAIELFYDGTVVDLFGDVDTDGTGEALEYLDAWAFEIVETRTPSTNFSLSDWTIAALTVLMDLQQMLMRHVLFQLPI